MKYNLEMKVKLFDVLSDKELAQCQFLEESIWHTIKHEVTSLEILQTVDRIMILSPELAFTCLEHALGETFANNLRSVYDICHAAWNVFSDKVKERYWMGQGTISLIEKALDMLTLKPEDILLNNNTTIAHVVSILTVHLDF